MLNDHNNIFVMNGSDFSKVILIYKSVLVFGFGHLFFVHFEKIQKVLELFLLKPTCDDKALKNIF